MIRFPTVRWACLAMSLVALAGCGKGSSTSSGANQSYANEANAALNQPPETRALTLTKLAYRRAKAKDELGAEQTFQQALAACREIKDPTALIEAYALVAEAHTRLGNAQAAQYAIKSATDALGRIQDPEARCRALVTLAEVQALAGDPAAAANLKAAEQSAAEIKAADGTADSYAQTLALGRVAVGYLGTGQADQSERVLQAAIARAQTLDQERLRAVAVAEVAIVFHKAKKPDVAAKTFEKAMAAARNIAKPQPKAYALAEVAQRLAAAGQAAQAKRLVEEADAVAHKIPEADQQQQAVVKIRQIMDELRK